MTDTHRSEKHWDTTIKGSLLAHNGLFRCSVSNGATALLDEAPGRHGRFLAVASFLDKERGPMVPSVRELPTHGTVGGGALQLPTGLTLGNAASSHQGGQTDTGSGSLASLTLSFYSVFGDLARLAAPPSLLQTHSIRLPFSLSSSSTLGSVDAAPIGTTAALKASTVEKILWAGPRLVAVMNTLGEVLICKTQLDYNAPLTTTASCSEEDDDERVDYGCYGGSTDNGSGDLVMTRCARAVDVAAADSTTSSHASSFSLFCVAGVRSVRAFWVRFDTVGRQQTVARDLCEWDIGAFHSIAIHAEASRASAGTSAADAVPPRFVIAGCTRTGAVHVYEWEAPAESGLQGGQRPTAIGQVLMGPQTSFWGVVSGGCASAPVFAVVGVAPRTSHPQDDNSQARTATPDLYATKSNVELNAPDILSPLTLRGKDGRRLAVEDLLLQERKDLNLGETRREPMNAVVAHLRRTAEEGGATSRVTSDATTLEEIAPAVLVAPPVLSPETHTTYHQEIFLLTVTVDTKDAHEAHDKGGTHGFLSKAGHARCATRYASLGNSGPGRFNCTDAMKRFQGSAFRILPRLFPKDVVGGNEDDTAFHMLLYDQGGALSLEASVDAEKGLTVAPVAWYSVAEESARDGVCQTNASVLAGLDCCASSPTSSPGQESGLLILALVGTQQNAADDAEGHNAPEDSHSPSYQALSLLELRVRSEEAFAIQEREKDGATSSAAAILGTEPLRAVSGVDEDALRSLVRAVVREENMRLLAEVDDRVSKLEAKLDRILSRLTE